MSSSKLARKLPAAKFAKQSSWTISGRIDEAKYSVEIGKAVLQVLEARERLHKSLARIDAVLRLASTTDSRSVEDGKKFASFSIGTKLTRVRDANNDFGDAIMDAIANPECLFAKTVSDAIEGVHHDTADTAWSVLLLLAERIETSVGIEHSVDQIVQLYETTENDDAIWESACRQLFAELDKVFVAMPENIDDNIYDDDLIDVGPPHNIVLPPVSTEARPKQSPIPTAPKLSFGATQSTSAPPNFTFGAKPSQLR